MKKLIEALIFLLTYIARVCIRNQARNRSSSMVPDILPQQEQDDSEQKQNRFLGLFSQIFPQNFRGNSSEEKIPEESSWQHPGMQEEIPQLIHYLETFLTHLKMNHANSQEHSLPLSQETSSPKSVASITDSTIKNRTHRDFRTYASSSQMGALPPPNTESKEEQSFTIPYEDVQDSQLKNDWLTAAEVLSQLHNQPVDTLYVEMPTLPPRERANTIGDMELEEEDTEADEMSYDGITVCGSTITFPEMAKRIATAERNHQDQVEINLHESAEEVMIMTYNCSSRKFVICHWYK